MSVTDKRHATLKFTEGPTGPVLSARVPGNMSEDEFVAVSREAYRTVANFHHCTCLSGRVSFVVEDIFADVISVDLNRSAP